MSPRPGNTSRSGPQNAHSQSPEESPSSSYPLGGLASPQYKDEEDPEQARGPGPGPGPDLEVGSDPLLPAEHFEDLDSDSDIDDYLDREELKRDPPFSCTPVGFVAWCRGPVPPHIYRVNPWFPKWQAAPTRLVDRWAPRRWMKIALLLVGLVVWIAVFFSTLKASVAGQGASGYGRPVKLSCHHRLWYVLFFAWYCLVQALISRQQGQCYRLRAQWRIVSPIRRTVLRFSLSLRLCCRNPSGAIQRGRSGVQLPAQGHRRRG